MNLTAKQKAFVQEYLIDLNATQAAIRAGYSEKTAYEIGRQNLNKLEIQEAIKAKADERSIQSELTEEWVLQRLKFIADTCSKPDENGKIDSKGAVRAVELIGKHRAMFTDKLQADITGTIQTTLSLDDRLKLISDISNDKHI